MNTKPAHVSVGPLCSLSSLHPAAGSEPARETVGGPEEGRYSQHAWQLTTLLHLGQLLKRGGDCSIIQKVILNRQGGVIFLIIFFFYYI